MTILPSEKLVDLIHPTPTRVVLFVTGGGLEVFHTLTYRGGGSATLLSGFIPYTPEETIELLGCTPEKLVSEATTRTMAVVAYQRALKLTKGEGPVIGVAVSSVLQRTPTEREGRVHTIYGVMQSDTKTVSVTINLPASVRPMRGDVPHMTEQELSAGIRNIEDMMVSTLALDLVAEGCGLSEVSMLPSSGQSLREMCAEVNEMDPAVEVYVRKESTIQSDEFKALYAGTTKAVVFDIVNGEPMTFRTVSYEQNAPKYAASLYIFPGSFRPLHDGHREMAALTTEQDYFHGKVDFEISIHNVDKPALDLLTIEERLRSFTGMTCRVWLTNAPTFYDKAQIFQDRIFVVGHDTAVRICNPKYGDLNRVYAAFAQNGIKFVVFGRIENGVQYEPLDGLSEQFCERATAITAPRKYVHVSSSGIRNQLATGSGLTGATPNLSTGLESGSVKN